MLIRLTWDVKNFCLSLIICFFILHILVMVASAVCNIKPGECVYSRGHHYLCNDDLKSRGYLL